jgi:hypothetical protein
VCPRLHVARRELHVIGCGHDQLRGGQHVPLRRERAAHRRRQLAERGLRPQHPHHEGEYADELRGPGRGAPGALRFARSARGCCLLVLLRRSRRAD